MQKDFAGFFVNIEDEIDHYNRKSNEVGIMRRFKLDDIEKLDLEEKTIRGMITFMISPDESGYLENIKPKIKEDVLQVLQSK